MRLLLRILLLMMSLCSLAHAGKCDNMPEGDNKSLCAAIDQKASRFCDLISNPDSRHSCVARVQINSYACDNIKSIRARAECLYQVRKDQANSIYIYQSGKKIWPSARPASFRSQNYRRLFNNCKGQAHGLHFGNWKTKPRSARNRLHSTPFLIQR